MLQLTMGLTEWISTPSSTLLLPLNTEDMANVLFLIQEAIVVAEPLDQYKVSAIPESLRLPMAQSE
jgi:hypothetical protein